MTRLHRRLRVALALALLAALGSSCAYYNTFYLARKNYDRATEGAPYLVDKAQAGQAQAFVKSADYAKKVLARYPRSKWADDAYLMWAKSLLGQGDPLQTVNMLQEFATLYPESKLRHQATFYLGVGLLRARRYSPALKSLEEFLAAAPRDPLAPYAMLERSRALMALQQPGDAADAAAEVIEKFPKSSLVVEAHKARAEALFARGDFGHAREEYRFLGARSLNEEERLGWLLRESDCLEGTRDLDGALALLKEALAYEQEPVPPPPGAPGTPAAAAALAYNPLATAGGDHYGRLLLRIGSVHLLAGRLEPALEAYRDVLTDYPRTTLAAEAQYRLGYAYETVGDDFDKARVEYAKVKEQGAGGSYGEQATLRLGTLDRLAQYRIAGGDSVERLGEAGFARAEVYLFQLEKPERALQEYQRLAGELKGTPYEAKALTAQAWVLSRKLDRKPEADSLFWEVVRQHPATEAQLAARDYLEAEGAEVDPGLIRLPERPLLAHVDTTRLSPPPLADQSLGQPQPAPGDSTRLGGPEWQRARFRTHPPGSMPGDSAGFAGRPVRPDFMPHIGSPGALGDSSALAGHPAVPGLVVPPVAPGDSSALAGTPRKPSGGPGLATARPDSAAPPANAGDVVVAPAKPAPTPGLVKAKPDSIAPPEPGRVPAIGPVQPAPAPSEVKTKPDSVAPPAVEPVPAAGPAKPTPAPSVVKAKPDSAAAAADSTRAPAHKHRPKRPPRAPAAPDTARSKP